MNTAERDGVMDRRPVDPRTGRPIGPMAQPGYYPGYRTLDQRNFWDAKTREVVLKRVENVPPIRFFSQEQADLMESIANRIIPQDDRDEQHRIPIVPHIDERLYEDRQDGYRQEDMPPDREAFPLGLEGIQAIARHLHGRAFTELGPREQDEVLESVHHGKPPAGEEIWKRLPVHRFWMMLVKDCAEAYYAHPWAWDEIGYGGPAYPRGYMRLEHGEPEPWEVKERRYDWKAPESSLSDTYEPVSGTTEHYATPGQQGTH